MIDFAKHGIDTPSGRTSGQYKTKCPNCINNRSNKRDRSLSVDLATGLFNCHYCGWKGCAAGSDKHWSDKIFVPKVAPKPKPKPQPSFHDIELLNKTMIDYNRSIFAQWLSGIVGDKPASEAIGRYNVGVSNHGGKRSAAAFWQVDINGNIRCCKVIPYGKNGRRRKDITPPATWAHSLLDIKDFTLVQCFFGEHLLKNTFLPVAICESEKTAILGSIYMPNMIWLACGGADGMGGENELNDKCEVLRSRVVILFPDLKKPNAKKVIDWNKKAKQLSKICTCSVSTLIEQYATEQERQEGLDIGDYFIRFAPSDFVKQQPSVPGFTPLKNTTVTAVVTERKTPPSNPTVVAMCDKNPVLPQLMQTFDCEVTNAYTDCRLLTSEELRQLAQQIPEHDAFAPEELCNMLNIEIHDVAVMIDDKEILLCPRRELCYRKDTTPF